MAMTFQEYLSEGAEAQNRGICQICGREQAVRDKGNITHHGYTIQDGWFQGTCPGQQHKPLQIEKSETERQIDLITKELPKVLERIAKLHSGALHPLKVKKSDRWADRKEMIDWADAPIWAQQKAVQIAIQHETQRHKSGVDTIVMLKRLIDQYHGKDLKKIERAPPKAPIVVGSVVDVAGKKGVTVTKISNKAARGMGPSFNGQSHDHVHWVDGDKEYSYMKRFAKHAK